MKKVKVDVSSKEVLSWPPLCVLCFKPKPERYAESYCGGVKLRYPYCQDCYDKVTRRQKWLVERSATVTAVFGGYGGIIAGVVYMVNEVRKRGGVELLNIGNWKIAFVLGFVVLGVIFFVLSFLGAVLEPVVDRILLSRFPNKFAKEGVEVKFGTRKKVVYPMLDTKVETEEVVLEELEFANPEYAEKFRKVNRLGEFATSGLREI